VMVEGYPPTAFVPRVVILSDAPYAERRTYAPQTTVTNDVVVQKRSELHRSFAALGRALLASTPLRMTMQG